MVIELRKNYYHSYNNNIQFIYTFYIKANNKEYKYFQPEDNLMILNEDFSFITDIEYKDMTNYKDDAYYLVLAYELNHIPQEIIRKLIST